MSIFGFNIPIYVVSLTTVPGEGKILPPESRAGQNFLPKTAENLNLCTKGKILNGERIIFKKTTKSPKNYFLGRLLGNLYFRNFAQIQG